MAAYPELLTEGAVRVPESGFSSEQLRDLERNLSFLIEKNYSAIQAISQQLTGLKNWIKNNTLRLEITDMVELLLSNENIFNTKSISELESFYPHYYMREFTPEILSELKRRGLVQVLPGDKLKWLI